MNRIFHLTITTIFIIIVATVLIVSLKLDTVQAQDESKITYLVIKKIGKNWKVVDAADNKKTEVKAKRGERISWIAEGTDVFFQFMDDNLFDQYNNRSKSGKPLVLKINAHAEKKTYEYAVFCLTDSVFARGDSPPKIIVD